MAILRNLFGPPNIDRLKAKKDVKGLIEALAYQKDRDVRVSAAEALGEIGDTRPVEPLIASLKDEDWRVRKAAVEALGRIGDRRAVEALMGALKDDSEDVRDAAAEALGKIDAPRALELLISALKDGDRSGRCDAIRALGALGDQRAVEPLIGALKDKELLVRKEAARALEKIGWDAESAADKESVTRYRITLGQWDLCAKIGSPAVEPLIAALKDEDWQVRKAAVEVLGKIGDKRAMEALGDALKDDSRDVREAAAEALGPFGDQRAVEAPIDAFEDTDKDVRKAAAEAPRASKDQLAAEALIDALKRPRYEYPYKVVKALQKIGSPAVEPLIVALKDANWGVRYDAAMILGKIGDVRAAKPLLDALKDEESQVRKQAAMALEEIGRDAEIAEDKGLVAAYRIALGQWDSCITIGSPAVEPLIAALRDKEFDVRKSAAWALGRIGDRRAVKPLEESLKDGDWGVREAAANALGEFGVQQGMGWAEVDEKNLHICAKCGRTEQSILQDFEEARRRGVAVIGSGDVLYYCVNCEKSFCGRCQIDLGGQSGPGCPECKNRLQPVSKITHAQGNAGG